MCNKTEIVEQIATIIETNIDFIHNIGMNDDLEELGINSLSFIRIVVEIEEKFNLEFEDGDLSYEKFSTIEDIANYIIEKNQSKKGGKDGV